LRESRDNWNNLSDGPTFDKKRVEKDEEWEEKDREQRKKKADKLAKMKEEAAKKETQSKEKARPGSSGGDENKSNEEAKLKEGDKKEEKKGKEEKSKDEDEEEKKDNEEKSKEEDEIEERNGNEHKSDEEAKFEEGQTSEGKERSDKSNKSDEDIEKEDERERDEIADSKDSKQIETIKVAPQEKESSNSKSSDDKKKDTNHDDAEKKEFLAQGDHKEEQTKKGTREKRAEIQPYFDAAAKRRTKPEIMDEVETNSGRPEKRDAIEDQRRPEPLTETEKKAYLSFEDCGAACKEDKECFQYVYYEQTCKLSHAFRLGKYKAPDSQGEVVWKSGWMLKKIRLWVEMNHCQELEWPNWGW
jgi:hypothetical protein